jgi:hypothetical protein
VNEATSSVKSLSSLIGLPQRRFAEDAVRALAFERGKLSQLFHDEAEAAGIIYQLLGRELAYKIKVSNTQLSTGATSLSY